MGDTDKKASILAKIKALLAKTKEQGATEQEAIAATAKAAELMATYHVSVEEVAKETSQFASSEISAKRKWHLLAYEKLSPSVAKLTGCMPILTQGSGGRKISFFGERGDAIFASWLCQSLGDFIVSGLEHDEKRFRKTFGRVAPSVSRINAFRRGYILSAAVRIAARIREIIATQAAAQVANALIPAAREDTAEAEWERLNGKIENARSGRLGSIDQTGVRLGFERGDDASFARPIDGHASMMIGGGNSHGRELQD